MKQCRFCHKWWNNEMLICPACDAMLINNEASSEDADEGIFTEIIKHDTGNVGSESYATE